VTAILNQALVLATQGAEGVPPSHIAAKIAVPIAIVIFCGSVYMLLWANYGAKKGALIYGTAFFAFTAMMGTFWWFGAPGTPVFGGPQNFPGQTADVYQAKWFPFEPDSARADYFSSTNNLGDFETVAQYLGKGNVSEADLENDPKYKSVNGDVTQAGALMTDLYLHVQNGEPQLGGSRRAQYQDAGQAGLEDQVGADAAAEYTRGSPFFSATPGPILVTKDQGTEVVGTMMTAYVNYVGPDGEDVAIQVDQGPMFAFKEPSRLWLPSAVWTLVSLVLFALMLFGLDRVEQREKKALAETEEPERLAVPIRQ
jgi:hypothetical protein